jgi:transglutaminase-like putative cysteine protease
VIVCLAANVTRLMPPENAVQESRIIDRMITVVFALGLTALFFRPSVNGVTLAAAGGLPMAMVVLAREAGMPGAAGAFAPLIVWGLVALLIATDLVERLTRTRSAEEFAPGFGELGRRILLLGIVAGLAFGLRVPVEGVARTVQKQLFGWMYMERASSGRTGDLLLTQVTPGDFGRRMRVVLLVDAAGLPGYLRESVFLRYRDKRWSEAKPDLPLKETASLSSGPKRNVYALRPGLLPSGLSEWHVEVLAPALLHNVCLPGTAVTLACDGSPPLSDTNGTVAANGVFPAAYVLQVAPVRLIESAYPQPDGLSDPAYLEVPDVLAGAVSNWVSGCAGLADASAVPMAIRRVEDHFATNFTYRLGVQMRAGPDPLVDFMTRKEGACTLFASAAALMFRGCGIPSRVVSGYVCVGWNPWLKRWTARERDGHAWVEVWDRSSGRWLVADPTPPDGNPAAFNKPGKIRLAFDLCVAGWKRFLVYMQNTAFLVVLADAGATLFLFLWQVVWSLPGMVVLAGFGAVWWLRRRTCRLKLTPTERMRSELIQAMRKLERRGTPAHLRRRPFENWSAWLRRIGPELSPERLKALREALEGYQELRYSVTLDEPAVRAWLARMREVKF